MQNFWGVKEVYYGIVQAVNTQGTCEGFWEEEETCRANYLQVAYIYRKSQL